MQSNSPKSTSPYTAQLILNDLAHKFQTINSNNNNKSSNNVNKNNSLRVSLTTTPIQKFQISHSELPVPPIHNPVLPSINKQNQVNNNQQPMITIPLSVLNDLVQKINSYELFITQLFATNPLNDRHKTHASNMYMFSMSKNMPNFMCNNIQKTDNVIKKTEPECMTNNHKNNAFYCGADTADTPTQTAPNKQQMIHNENQNKIINKIIKKECEKSENKYTENNKADTKISTRSFNKRIGDYYPIKAENDNLKTFHGYQKEDECFVCEVCRKRYKYLCNLRSHAKVHTDSAYVCEFCNKRFGRKSNYMEHKMVHTGELVYKCNVCNRGFRQKHRWKDHFKIHHQNIYNKLSSSTSL